MNDVGFINIILSILLGFGSVLLFFNLILFKTLGKRIEEQEKLSRIQGERIAKIEGKTEE